MYRWTTVALAADHRRVLFATADIHDRDHLFVVSLVVAFFVNRGRV
jgi:hypothetical protein